MCSCSHRNKTILWYKSQSGSVEFTVIGMNGLLQDILLFRVSPLYCMMLTGGVSVVHKVHLEGVSIVQDALGVGRVVLELQGLQGGVEAGLLGDDVDGGLPRPVGHRVVIDPAVGSCSKGSDNMC